MGRQSRGSSHPPAGDDGGRSQGQQEREKEREEDEFDLPESIGRLAHLGTDCGPVSTAERGIILGDDVKKEESILAHALVGCHGGVFGLIGLGGDARRQEQV